jgi:hypothetical protein
MEGRDRKGNKTQKGQGERLNLFRQIQGVTAQGVAQILIADRAGMVVKLLLVATDNRGHILRIEPYHSSARGIFNDLGHRAVSPCGGKGIEERWGSHWEFAIMENKLSDQPASDKLLSIVIIKMSPKAQHRSGSL